MTGLNRYWPSLLAAHTSLRDRLVGMYDEPHRGYHNRKHLVEVFARIDVILEAEPDTSVDRDALMLATWFHDAVYDTVHDVGADNEQRSATLAERELGTADVPPVLIEEVARLVRLTQTHQVTGSDTVGGVLCDADLGILAADEQRYTEYAQGVRREYAHIADVDFCHGRARILRDLLAATTLFHTSFAKQHWEVSARANIAHELTELET